MSRAVVLVSGGIDSAGTLVKALEEEDGVTVIHFRYGQRTQDTEWSLALEATGWAARKYINTYSGRKVVTYTDVFSKFSSGLTSDEEDFSQIKDDSDLLVGYVPMRNLHFLTTAGAIAYQNDAENIYIGIQAGDPDSEDWVTPDQSKPFIKSAEEALNESSDKSFSIKTPLSEWDKSEVIEYLHEREFPLEATFSCYEEISDRVACGQCAGCNERIEAFKKLELQDPIAYHG